MLGSLHSYPPTLEHRGTHVQSPLETFNLHCAVLSNPQMWNSRRVTFTENAWRGTLHLDSTVAFSATISSGVSTVGDKDPSTSPQAKSMISLKWNRDRPSPPPFMRAISQMLRWNLNTLVPSAKWRLHRHYFWKRVSSSHPDHIRLFDHLTTSYVK